jgi:hypothetical protein
MSTAFDHTHDIRPFIVDQLLPVVDVELAEHRIVDADPARTFAAARDLDFLAVRTPLLDAAMFARGLPSRIRRQPPPELGSMRLADAAETGTMELPGWLFLGEEPGREIAFGAVGRFWQPDIEWRQVPLDEFAAFDEPGWGKIAAHFSVRPHGSSRTLLTYDCRVATTDEPSRRRFRRYWWLVQPFVGHIFRATLATIATDAERPG